MAGIGFTLRRMLREEGFGGPLRALGYAAIIAAGPWITSSTSLALLGFWSALPEGSPEFKVFLAIVNYVYAFSLIGVGACHMVASRYLADRLYEDIWSDFAPAFAQLLAPLMIVQAAIGLIFMSYVPTTFAIRVTSVVLYLAVSGVWLAMIYLTAAKDFRTIVFAFVGGFVAAVWFGIIGGWRYGLPGQLAGFTAGYLVTFFVLVFRIKREFGLPTRRAEGLGVYFYRFWPLAVTGLCYNVGIWIDKILFWYHPTAGEEVLGALHVSQMYDNAMFMAYITIVPAMGMFLLRVETDFYDAWRGYFASIAAHETLQEVRAAKHAMARSLIRNLGLLLKVQGPITALAVLFAPEAIGALHMQWLSLYIFRFGAIGAMFHVMHLMVLILLLYLEFRMEAMFLSLTFVSTNLVFTLWAFQGGLPFYGAGYALACGVTLMVGVLLLARGLRDLEFHVFMRQPLL